jgi:hypothetical protein
LPDLRHVCGDALCVAPFARAITALGLGAVMIFCHSRLLKLFYWFSGADDELTGKLQAQAHDNHQFGSQGA